MQFAISYPWWALLLLAAAIVAVAWGFYAGAIVPLSPRRRAVLAGLRALVLLVLVACLLRPVRVVPPDVATDAVVPVLIDVSRSMRLADMDGASRIVVARDLLEGYVRPALDRRFRSELWSFGDALEPVTETRTLAADARRSDLSGALRAVRERYRQRRVAAVVVISDGGDTGTEEPAAAADAAAVPVYAIGVGAPQPPADFEVLDVSAGEMAHADSSIDITVTAISRGNAGSPPRTPARWGANAGASAAPFDLRVLENGRPIDLRHVTPEAGGGPVRAVFTVSPSRETPTLYTVEIPSAAGELALENNRRSVLVEPPGRRRRVLMIEGAPGFEHAFIKRALAGDPGIEVDSVVRKGRDARGSSTYYVQATERRAARLTTGFPQERSALYEYDAIILANVEADALSRAQLDMLATFVDDRGGGLLVLGAKSFVQQGFAGTPLEPVLPVGLTERGSGVMRASSRVESRLAVSLTDEGQVHPVMRIDAADTLEQRWRAVPPLVGVAALGALRPGAQALALVHAPDGPRPLVAVQRYGQGRSMVFTGEASWRWRMQLPSTDRTHELFWRQAVRWVSASAPDPVDVAPLSGLAPGMGAAMTVDVRSDAFAPIVDADVRLSIARPGGTTEEVVARLADPQTGRYTGELRFDEPGIYRVSATATREGAPLGRAARAVLVGGADLEMADPRLNEEVLRRVALASGGAYVSASQASMLSSLLKSAAAAPSAPRLEELWHNAWIFVALVGLLAAEWTLRRQWGLR
ncbi:MAG: hypothetical protein HYY76_10485 [Acidobacteria bacterium]|nr:hypothetical protein [Acidobacteriota bacterium]